MSHINVQREIAEIDQALCHLKSEVAWLRLKFFAGRLIVRANFHPSQPRVPAGHPDGGQWTSEGRPFAQGARLYLIQSRDPRAVRMQRIGGRWVEITPAEETELAYQELDTQLAIENVRRYDSDWNAAQGVYEPGSYAGRMAYLRAAEVEANARYLAIIRERGIPIDPNFRPRIGHNNPPEETSPGARAMMYRRMFRDPSRPQAEVSVRPLGFATDEDYREFQEAAVQPLIDAGYTDATVIMRGSSVVGFSYSQSVFFGTNPGSDYDLAIVSEKLFDEIMRLEPNTPVTNKKIFLRNDSRGKILEAKLGLSGYSLRLQACSIYEVSIAVIRGLNFYKTTKPYSVIGETK